MLSTDVPLSSTKIAIVVVTLDTTPTLPASDEKNFYDIFMSKNISKAIDCQQQIGAAAGILR